MKKKYKTHEYRDSYATKFETRLTFE